MRIDQQHHQTQLFQLNLGLGKEPISMGIKSELVNASAERI